MSPVRCAGCGYGLELHVGPKKNCPGALRAVYRKPVIDVVELRIRATSKMALLGPLNCFPTRVEWEVTRGTTSTVRALAPLIPARAPTAPEEFAAGQGRQAAGMGRAATDRGWKVRARYWKAADGAEGCAVQMHRGTDGAVATWARPADLAGGKTGWKAGVAYGWNAEGGLGKITHTRLLEWIMGDER